MKRTALWLILVAGLITGCQDPGLKQNEARISGILTPALPGYVNITAGPVLDSAKINKDGEFEIVIPLDESMKALLFFGNRFTNVYLEPGKSVSLAINSMVFPDKINFEGELGPVNRYLTLARKLDQQTAIPANDLYAKEPLPFIRYTDSIKQLKLKLLDEFDMKYQQIDAGFIARIRSDIELSSAHQHLQYPGNYQLIRRAVPVIPEDYHFDYRRSLNLNSSENLASQAYQEFIQSYLDYRLNVYLAEHPTINNLIFPESVARFRVIHEEFTDPDVIDYLLYTAMHDHLANFGTMKMESFLTDFRLHCKNEEYLKTIDGIVTNMEKVGIGKPAPNFTAYQPDGKKVNLSDYFGELLYIGFWASWSEWSLQEIPYFEQLRRDFAGKPVKFMLVSLDFEKDKKLWSAIIEKNNFGSIQLMQDPKSTVLADSYYLNDFPRYFLIDKNGKIISVYAPRPTENIAETLNRAIGTGL
jgi:peroxiredoxin